MGVSNSTVASVPDDDTTTTTTRTIDAPPSPPSFPLPPNFTSCCVRALQWDEDFAARVIVAYREFMELKIRLQDWNATKLAAPPLIELVWQQHVLNVAHYVQACGENLIHHTPQDNLRVDYEPRVRATELTTTTTHRDDEIWSFSKHKLVYNEDEQRPTKRQRSSDEDDKEEIYARKEPITFRVRWEGNTNLLRPNDLYFKIRPETKMARVFERFNMHWADNNNDDDDDDDNNNERVRQGYTFFLGGRLIRPDDTANSIGLVGDDVVCATRCNAVEDTD